MLEGLASKCLTERMLRLEAAVGSHDGYSLILMPGSAPNEIFVA